MKPIHEVDETRKKYHLYPNKNTVHRSSLMAPAIAGCDVYISFLNHFLLKRGYQSVALKITAVGRQGNLLDSITFDVKDPIVYTFNLSRLFAEKNPENFLVEFFSDKNLFIPFPAVMVNHVGKDFVNVVHSYNRVLNDIFENDSVNKTQVAEASIDVVCDSTYDTFVTFATGIVSVRDSLRLSYAEKNKSVQGALAIDLPRLSSKSYFLSEVIPDLKNSKGGVIKLSQPVQSMFYGRLLAGIVNRQTGAFSANHSYYDSSAVAEYFPDPDSYRTYPFFAEFANKIAMYPIMSPGDIKLKIRIVGTDRVFESKEFPITSPSSEALIIDVNEMVKSEKIHNPTAFSVLATGLGGRIPTRVNHQLIYGEPGEKSALNGTINVSLANRSVFTPDYKKGYRWGQFLRSAEYESRLGLCLDSPDGSEDKVTIEFYTTQGLAVSHAVMLKPGTAAIFKISEILKHEEELEFGWFIAKCDRADLTAYCFHYHKHSCNASGEHSF